MVGGVNVVVVIMLGRVIVRSAGVGAEDAAVVVRVLLLLRMLVVVIRACEDDDATTTCAECLANATARI
jgi:hypothetical protein